MGVDNHDFRARVQAQVRRGNYAEERNHALYLIRLYRSIGDRGAVRTLGVRLAILREEVAHA